MKGTSHLKTDSLCSSADWSYTECWKLSMLGEIRKICIVYIVFLGTVDRPMLNCFGKTIVTEGDQTVTVTVHIHKQYGYVRVSQL